MNKLIPVVLVAAILLGSTILVHDTSAMKKKDKKALKAIDKAIIRATEGHPARVDMVNISQFDNNNTETVYNKTTGISPPPPPHPTCPPGQYLNGTGQCVPEPTCGTNEHLENHVCVPNTPPPQQEICGDGIDNDGDGQIDEGCPPPNPNPNGNKSTVVVSGDFDCSAGVIPAMKNRHPTLFIGLGDLCYGSSLSGYKSAVSSLGNAHRCVIGNHDSPEDGSTSIYKEALAFCGDHWFAVVAHHVFIGINTNGDLNVQQKFIHDVLANKTIMNGTVAAHIDSHKPCFTNPNSHHPVEETAFCNSLNNDIAGLNLGIPVYYEAGHNHVGSSSGDGHWKVAGMGGRSHYSCGFDTTWTWCNAKDYGWLEYVIDNNSGAMVSQFYNVKGQIIH